MQIVRSFGRFARAVEDAGRGADKYSSVVDRCAWPITHCTDVILSFRVSQGCELRRPVVDSVADETPAA